MIDNDLNERCAGEERDTPMEKIDRYLKQIPSLTFVKVSEHFSMKKIHGVFIHLETFVIH